MRFDPDAAAQHDGIFGLPFSPGESRLVIVPVPFDATTSYRDGTRHGPAAVLAASAQVELHDADFGRAWEDGIAMLPLASGAAAAIARLNARARRLALPILARGGQVEGHPRLRAARDAVNRIGAEVNRIVAGTVRGLLAAGKTPVVLGGDHATAFGAIEAYAGRFPGLGILQVDAHADLRPAFEGFAWSHASIMDNVVSRLGGPSRVKTLVQVGVRDYGEVELQAIERRKGPGETRIVTHFEARLAAERARGRRWAAQCEAIVSDLPGEVYLSFDVDGLDPKLCPDTGTPVPGGLDWGATSELLRTLVASGRSLVGFDLNEVAPDRRRPRADWGDDWNANVGARLLYKLLAAVTRGREGVTRAKRRRSGSARRS